MRTFTVDDHKTFETEREVADYIVENMTEEYYDEMLDECYPPVKFGDLEYQPSIALYRLDEVAYRCGMNDYYDSLASDIVYDLERFDDEETEDFYGFSVVCNDPPEEDEEEEEPEEEPETV